MQSRCWCFMSHLAGYHGTAAGHVPKEQHRSIPPRNFGGPQPSHCSRRRHARRHDSPDQAECTVFVTPRRNVVRETENKTGLRGGRFHMQAQDKAQPTALFWFRETRPFIA